MKVARDAEPVQLPTRGRALRRRLARALRPGGFRWLVGAALDRVYPARPAMRAAVLAATLHRQGLEVGGPSRAFGRRGIFPVYPRASRIDNVNFAHQTAWEDASRDGGEFRFDATQPPGTQWIREAIALTGLANESYDFLLSSHCLEHVANPLAALVEWKRVTKVGGHLVLLLPDPKKTFDHARPTTTLAHLRADRDCQQSEHDLTHLDEVLALHDVARDPDAGTAAEFATRAKMNALNRCLHHHVFNLEVMSAALAETGWTVLSTERARPLHLIALARKDGS